MFLQRCTVRNLVIAVERGLESKNLAMLWLAAYAVLLRVPSEALPMCRGGGDFDQAGVEQSVLFLKDANCLCLRLKSRKNKAEGTVLKRGCSCAAHEKTCPIHVLWHGYFEKLESGSKPWAYLSAETARSHLRSTLADLKAQCLSCASRGAYVSNLVFESGT